MHTLVPKIKKYDLGSTYMYVHVRIQKFLSGGGGGGSCPTTRKQPGQHFSLFFSPQLILQFSEGIHLFPGEWGCSNAANFYINPYNF